MGARSLRAIIDTSVLIAADVPPPLAGELAISAAALAELHLGVLVTTDGSTGRAVGRHTPLAQLVMSLCANSPSLSW